MLFSHAYSEDIELNDQEIKNPQNFRSEGSNFV